MSTISQKEYLKKYLGIGKGSSEKKKKKKPKIKSTRLKIVDDNDLPSLEDEIKEDLAGDNEDAPQIVEVIDDRPPSLQIDETTKIKLWKPLGAPEDESMVTTNVSGLAGFKLTNKLSTKSSLMLKSSDSHRSVNKVKKVREFKNEFSPPRKIKEEIVSPDNSPVRHRKNEDSDTDLSPKRQRNVDDNSPTRRNKDLSPPSRRKPSSDSDLSPKRERNDDSSPPRRKIPLSPRRNRGDDSSPLGRNKREVISPPRRNKSDDISPPRRKRGEDDSSHRRNRNGDSPMRNRSEDISPVRRNRGEDSSPPRRNRSDDSSPPRRNRRDDRSKNKSERRSRWDQDNSPPRKIKTEPESPPRKNLGGEYEQQRRERDSFHTGRPRDADESPPRRKKVKTEDDRSNKAKTTLDGKKAGLQSAKELGVETEALKKNEEEFFGSMSAEVSGRNAATVVRNKKKEVDPVEEAKKLQREKEMKEKYDRWGKGLKQTEHAHEKMQEELHQMSKPLARYADDEDLERHLKEQEREGDPMLAYIRKKKKKTMVEAGVPEKPMYMGEFMPNRFGIPPGYRWDGVDRSNGYEKKWFEVQNKKKANIEESYKWSTEDM